MAPIHGTSSSFAAHDGAIARKWPPVVAAAPLSHAVTLPPEGCCSGDGRVGACSFALLGGCCSADGRVDVRGFALQELAGSMPVEALDRSLSV